ncbi:MAG: FKBP-type peptidyl-prolyl cis-trans isomerase [Deltaproteobacteria bacterium]|nr:FKBP-type peptidyl-prolyl cis-trans isomerase [Deltaproteobacteria bacterium]
MTLRTSLAALALLLPLAARAEGAPKTDEEKTLYTLGLMVGDSLKPFSLTKKELETVKKGMEDSVLGNKKLTEIQEWGPKVQALGQTRAAAAAEKEKAAAKDFMAKKAKEPGAKVTASGLIFKSLSPGTGAQPKPTDRVSVNYAGTFIDGKPFDSSKPGQPANFALNQVVACWTEGLGMMKVGEKAQLICPASIAYGDRGRPGIPGGATLVFTVELLGIDAPAGANSSQPH